MNSNASPAPDPGLHIHLMGLGGAGLAAIGQVLLDRGFRVSGCDRQANDRTAALATAGAQVFQGHDPAHLREVDRLVVSSAIPADQPEIEAARAAGIPVARRAEFMGFLMAGHVGIAIAGTHGKTTTSAMLAHILLELGQDPTAIIGGYLATLGGHGRSGRGPHFVVEADEYDHMFLGLSPLVAVVTNVEHDHPDLFPTATDYARAFARFLGRLPVGGRLIIGTDDAGCRQLLALADQERLAVQAFGLDSEQARAIGDDLAAEGLWADWLTPKPGGRTAFGVRQGVRTRGLIDLPLAGDHNVRNALAATAAALAVGLPFDAIARALATFPGVGRRQEVIGEAAGVTVIDDYAHHPTEIRATLAAVRQRFGGRRLWAVWQPHTYSRTRLYLDEFAASLAAADQVLVLAIYASRERNTLGVDGAQVVARLPGNQARYCASHDMAVDHLLAEVKNGDLVLTLGAGDGDVVGRRLLAGLARAAAGHEMHTQQQKGL